MVGVNPEEVERTLEIHLPEHKVVPAVLVRHQEDHAGEVVQGGMLYLPIGVLAGRGNSETVGWCCPVKGMVQEGVRSVGDVGDGAALWLVLLGGPVLGILEMYTGDSLGEVQGEYDHSAVAHLLMEKLVYGALHLDVPFA